MFPEFHDYSIILASSSPRRQNFMRQLGFTFITRPADIDESVLPSEKPGVYVDRVAREKGNTVAKEIQNPEKPTLIISADTIVVMNHQILLKPENDVHAREMLTELSGHTHSVLTSVFVTCVVGAKRSQAQQTVQSFVTFRNLTKTEIEAYILCGEGSDKSGAYALAGIAGYFAKEVKGSVSGVIGLPLSELIDTMRAAIS